MEGWMADALTMDTRNLVLPATISSPSWMVTSVILLPFTNVPLALFRSMTRQTVPLHPTAKCTRERKVSSGMAKSAFSVRPTVTVSPSLIQASFQPGCRFEFQDSPAPNFVSPQDLFESRTFTPHRTTDTLFPAVRYRGSTSKA